MEARSLPAPPVTELGAVNGSQHGLLTWTDFIDDKEYVPELQWPNSVAMYSRMLTDAQIKGLLAGVRLPLLRRRWVINPNGADAGSVERLADDLGLPIKGEDDEEGSVRKRRRDRFSFKAHMTDALRALAYGHYFFEQVGEIDEDGQWRLRKLAPRPPRSIAGIKVAKDGGLESIKQSVGINAPDIPVSRLIAYVWDYEAGNWIGESMLRACFRHWLRKDTLLRVDVVKHQRTGAGMPTATAPPGASRQQIEALDAMARNFKVTEDGGGAVPHGTDLKLLGTSGSVPDTIASIRYDDEQMAGAFLAMFKQLGQTQTGSRALGESFVDFFSLGLDAIAEWLLDVFNQHMVEDWYDWNYGIDSQPAIIECLPPEDPNLDIGDLVSLIDSGAVKVDDEIENELRKRYKLPARSEPRPDDPVPPVIVPPTVPTEPDEESSDEGPEARRSRPKRAAAGSVTAPSFPLPPRTLRRQPYEHETLAAVDFAAIDANLTGSIDQLTNEVKLLQRAQIEQLHDMIADANGDLATLAMLQADPVAADAILAAMQRTADMGIDQAAAEATRQGVEQVKRPNLPEIEDMLTARAAATDAVLSRSISEAASRQALARTGEGMAAAQVADEVRDYLSNLTGKFLEDQLGGSMTQAMNTGRRLVMDANEPEEIYASELLDTATCTNCVARDGTLYPDLATAELDYPTGGYKECLGGPRCRGTLVGVYAEARSEGAGETMFS